MKILKGYLSLFSGSILPIVAWLLEWLDNVELLRLQKTFYLLSIVLICIGIIQVLFRRRAKSKRRKRIMEQMAGTQQAKKIVDLAKNPSKKGEVIVETFHLFQKGGKIVKAKFASLGIVQILSLVATLLLLGLSAASAFYPELSIVAENIALVMVMAGITATPGIMSHGKDLGEQFRSSIERMNAIKAANAKIKVAKKELDKIDAEYAWLKPYIQRHTLYNTPLTGEQALEHDNHQSQRQVFVDLIEGYKLEIKQLQEVQND